MSDSEDKIDLHRDNALCALVRTIEATGGLVTVSGKDMGLDDPECLVPKGDTEREWCDLAHAYLEACKALGVKPMIDGKRKQTPSVARVDLVLERSVNEEADDEDTAAVHAMAATFPPEITEVRVLDCDGVFLYYADQREG
jgi:hypothetical protein